MTNNELPNKIRLSAKEINHIITIFKKYFTTGDGLWIFGSRADMTSEGGDIDLYMETNSHITDFEKLTKQKLSFLVELKMAIGDQKIDFVINANTKDYHLAIYDVAKTEGIKLV